MATKYIATVIQTRYFTWRSEGALHDMSTACNRGQYSGLAARQPVSQNYVRQYPNSGVVSVDQVYREYVPPRDRMSQSDIVRQAEVNRTIFQELTRDGEPLPLDNGAGESIETTFREAMAQNILPNGLVDTTYSTFGIDGGRCAAEKVVQFVPPTVQDTGYQHFDDHGPLTIRPENIPGSERAFAGIPHNDFVKSVALQKPSLGGETANSLPMVNANLHVPLSSQNPQPDTRRNSGAPTQNGLPNEAFTIMKRTTVPRGRMTSKRARPQGQAKAYVSTPGELVDASHRMRAEPAAAKRIKVKHLQAKSFVGQGANGITDDKVRTRTELMNQTRRPSYSQVRNTSANVSTNSRSMYRGTDMDNVADKTSVNRGGGALNAGGSLPTADKTTFSEPFREKDTPQGGAEAYEDRSQTHVIDASRAIYEEYLRENSTTQGGPTAYEGRSHGAGHIDSSHATQMQRMRENSTSHGGATEYVGRSQTHVVDASRAIYEEYLRENSTSQGGSAAYVGRSQAGGASLDSSRATKMQRLRENSTSQGGPTAYVGRSQAGGASLDSSRATKMQRMRENSTSQGGPTAYESRSQTSTIDNTRTADVLKTYLASNGKLPNDPKFIQDLYNILSGSDVPFLRAEFQRLGSMGAWRGCTRDNITHASGAPSLSSADKTQPRFAKVRSMQAEHFTKTSQNSGVNDGNTLRGTQTRDTVQRQDYRTQAVNMGNTSLARGISGTQIRQAGQGASMVWEDGARQMRQRPEAVMLGHTAAYPVNRAVPVSLAYT